MSWIFLAILSYFITAVVMAVDKYILSQKAKSPLVYSFYACFLSSFVVLVWPFDFSFLPVKTIAYAFVAGASFFPALYFLNRAMVKGEADRAASIIGGISPLIILLLSFFVLGERLPASWNLAVLFLVFGSFILGFNGKRKPPERRTSINAFVSAIFFALTFFASKAVFLEASFLNAFCYIRFFTLMVVLPLFLSASFRNSLRSNSLSSSRGLFGFFVLNKAVSAFSFILLNYAILLGSVSVVNALQAVQYASVFFILLVFSYFKPGLVSRRAAFGSVAIKFLGIVFVSLGVVFLFLSPYYVNSGGKEIKELGVTFSKIQADRLGVDWQEAYEAILKDLEIKYLRIPAYWPEVEPKEGEFYFSDLDFMVEKAEEYNAKIILAVGIKLPRWPECHQPEWLENYELRIRNLELLDYIKTTVERYKDREAVWAWQVENEPFLNFGECDDYDRYFVDEEISLVKSLSDKPIVVTDGGEFGDWFRAYKRADIFGSTMYRHIYNEWAGEFTYPLPAFYFKLKRSLVELFLKDKPAMVIELQAEPWGKDWLERMTFEEQYRLFGPERFEEMMEYAKNSGFDTFYLWGAEWWYKLKEDGHSEMWELVKKELRN